MAIANASGNTLLSICIKFYFNYAGFFSAKGCAGYQPFAMNHYLHEQLFKAIKSKKEVSRN